MFGTEIGFRGTGMGTEALSLYDFYFPTIKFKGIYFELWNLLELFKQI